ncbi:biofilm regulation protein kinase SiaB [Paraburkholderia sp. J76]|uniref:biofilm regulation protein kinase SiaB n=1 Tax=Paraburkholderia sp. J76 TaxID=2805439 RepID=UPI002ABD82BD|nr:biofilm regulation protein kinase SiaB [Paraburkholderia sp. J76]
MELLDLLAMRESYSRHHILLCFNGPISRSLIEEIGNALRNYMHGEQANLSESMDVFSVYIEMTQNIRHYSMEHGYNEQNASATVAIGKNEDSRYVVSAGNLVELEDGRELVRTIEALARLDKAQLKAAYKEQLRRPRDLNVGSGAGLGLLDIARKSSAPLLTSLTEQPGGLAFFSLRAVI